VPDDVFAEAAKPHAQQALAASVTHIAAINTWNTLKVITGQVAGSGRLSGVPRGCHIGA
jgi:hypothetical protein